MGNTNIAAAHPINHPGSSRCDTPPPETAHRPLYAHSPKGPCQAPSRSRRICASCDFTPCSAIHQRILSSSSSTAIRRFRLLAGFYCMRIFTTAMVSRSLLLGSLLAVLARAQSLSTTSLATSRSTTSAASRSSTTSDVLILSGAGSLATVRPSTVTNQSIVVPAATFMNVSQIIVSSVSNIGDGAATTRPTNGTGTVTSFIGSSRSTTSHTTNSILVVGGATAASTATRTGTATSVAPLATNTQPCNNYVELCGRKYSNITNVCAHNAFFHVANNAASNQDYGVVVQLNDGIRMSTSAEEVVLESAD